MRLFSRPYYRFRFAPSCALFVPSLSPGPVLRVVERNAVGTRPAFERRPPPSDAPPASAAPIFPVLLSGPPARSDAHPPWRMLCLEDQYWQNRTKGASHAAHDFIHRLGPDLSRRLNATVYSLCVAPSGGWRIIRYENGEETDSDFEARHERWHPFTLYIPFLYNKAPEPPPKLAAWVEKRGLPLAEARRYARVVDYDTVAGLERKGLLIENEPVWYRYEVGPSPQPPSRFGEGVGGRGPNLGIIKP